MILEKVTNLDSGLAVTDSQSGFRAHDTYGQLLHLVSSAKVTEFVKIIVGFYRNVNNVRICLRDITCRKGVKRLYNSRNLARAKMLVKKPECIGLR